VVEPGEAGRHHRIRSPPGAAPRRACQPTRAGLTRWHPCPGAHPTGPETGGFRTATVLDHRLLAFIPPGCDCQGSRTGSGVYPPQPVGPPGSAPRAPALGRALRVVWACPLAGEADGNDGGLGVLFCNIARSSWPPNPPFSKISARPPSHATLNPRKSLPRSGLVQPDAALNRMG
jgi:hypothetical protein